MTEIKLLEKDFSLIMSILMCTDSIHPLFMEEEEVLMTERELLFAELSQRAQMEMKNIGSYLLPICFPFYQLKQSPKWLNLQRIIVSISNHITRCIVGNPEWTYILHSQYNYVITDKHLNYFYFLTVG